MPKIYKRGEFWHADFAREGRRVRISLKTNDKREAHRRLKDLLKNPTLPDKKPIQKDIPLKKLLEDYLVFARTEKAERVVREEGYVLTKFIKFLPVTTIRQIEISHIKDYKVAISDRKPNTIRNHLKGIRSFLNYARMMGFRADNPARSINLPKQPKQEPKYLTVGQVRVLIKALPGRARDIVYFFAKTGLRLSEGLGLTWGDVKHRHIIVRQTKNPNQSFRIVPVDEKVWAILNKLPKKREQVFTITRQQLRDDFEKARKKTGLEWVTIHTLRHTYASHLVMNGVGIRTVQELLGHTQIETTMIYAHLSMEHLEGAVKKLPY